MRRVEAAHEICAVAVVEGKLLDVMRKLRSKHLPIQAIEVVGDERRERLLRELRIAGMMCVVCDVLLS